MTFPTTITRREITAGVPFGLADGSDLVVEATIRPSRSMVWGALGFPGIAREYRVTSNVGLQMAVSLPVTDQVGWLDGLGNALSVTGGAQTHTYAIAIRFLTADGQLVEELPVKNIALPTGDLSSVDLDTLIPVSSNTGVTIFIPDSWSTQAVGGFLSGNLPSPGVNQAALSNAMLARTPIYWQPNTFYPADTQVIAPTDGSTVKRLVTGMSGTVYDPAAWSTVIPSAASVAANFPALRAVAPSASERAAGTVAYIDVSVVPPVLKGWDGAGWVALGTAATTPDNAVVSDIGDYITSDTGDYLVAA